ncbi:MAG: type I-U CRISPR-associated RAMP protein Csb1/Cas7u [Phycisphaeraceae bacterium]
MTELTKFDKWFEDDGPAALVIREHLIPVEGADGVFFPATYAAQPGADRDKEKFQGGYNIDRFPDGTNVCLVDSVGSQANRIEPLFAQKGYDDLVPQIIVTFPTKGIRLNLLHANHRAADAIVRCSAFEQELRTAFQERLRGNFEPLAKLAPTSLVFGVWDSRDTSAKVPRLLASTIRAFSVREHTRSANFLTQMTVDIAKLDILPDAGSKEGFANALASKAPGGVQLMPNGSIRRDSTISLAALRRLTVLESNGTLSVDRTKSLRRYILGLSLVGFTAPLDPFLRQGCNLVPDTDKPKEIKLVNLNGTRSDFVLSHSDVVNYARDAMKEFGIQPNKEQPFDVSIAEKASEAKPEKMNGAEVVSVDTAGKTFKVKFKKKESDVSTNTDTIIQKGNEVAAFEAVVILGAKLNLKVLNGMAVTITAKK